MCDPIEKISSSTKGLNQNLLQRFLDIESSGLDCEQLGDKGCGMYSRMKRVRGVNHESLAENHHHGFFRHLLVAVESIFRNNETENPAIDNLCSGQECMNGNQECNSAAQGVTGAGQAGGDDGDEIDAGVEGFGKIKGGTPEQREKMKAALKEMEKTSAGRETIQKLKSQGKKPDIIIDTENKVAPPNNACADLQGGNIYFSPEVVDSGGASIKVESDKGGQISEKLDSILVHEATHLVKGADEHNTTEEENKHDREKGRQARKVEDPGTTW